MARRDWVAAVFFIALAVYAGWVSLAELKVGTFVKPGPGFFPFLACLAIGLFASISLIKRLAGEKLQGKAGEIAISWKPRMLAFASLVGYIALLNVLGYDLTTFVFILFLLKAVVNKSWLVATLAALGVTAGAHIIFESILKSQLPSGLLGF